MATIEELRKAIPMPSHCPLCGKPLTEDNSALDHILPPRLGGKMEPDNVRYVCRACNARKADKYDHIYEYYYRLMKNKGVPEKDLAKKIDFALNSYSNNELNDLEKRIESMDPFYRRISAYATAIQKIMNGNKEEEEPSNEELAQNMMKTIAAYDKYDYSSEVREEINGNTFVFKKDFPIDQYRDELAEYGEEIQDEIYSVYIDEQGRLVVY